MNKKCPLTAQSGMFYLHEPHKDTAVNLVDLLAVLGGAIRHSPALCRSDASEQPPCEMRKHHSYPAPTFDWRLVEQIVDNVVVHLHIRHKDGIARVLIVNGKLTK